MKMSKTKILVVKDYANYCTELIGLLKDSGCFDVLPRCMTRGLLLTM